MSSLVRRTRLFVDGVDHWMNGKRMWLISGNILVIGLLVFILNYPLMKVSIVNIEGPEMWHHRAMDIAAPVGDSNLFHYDFEQVGRRLQAAFGARAQCDVQYVVPRGVSVVLTPTDPSLWTVAGRGVRADGALFATEADMPPSPIWRQTARRDQHVQTEAHLAAGVWSEVVDGDARFEHGASEWMRDAQRGWTMLAGNGQTRIILGWNNIEKRAAAAARLLEQRDSTLLSGCTIDARFDGRLIVRPDRRTAAVQPAAQVRQRDGETMALHLPVSTHRQGG
ncbi:MAG: hypothetical protein GF341_11770 [candidate division Zixibacteria bacterium]|nr:hypothetical protein [candidate division Zixibacteria bacterium]